MPREIGIGLLGVGWMGQLHTVAYRRVRDHYPECEAVPRFVIAADDVASRAELARDRLGYEHVTSDWREVLAHPDVEAVSITTPNHMHREMAIATAQVGKHFWGEKPLGRFPRETVEIAAAAEAAGIRTIVGLNYRHPPAVQYARQLIASGELGESPATAAASSATTPRTAGRPLLALPARLRRPWRARQPHDPLRTWPNF